MLRWRGALRCAALRCTVLWHGFVCTMLRKGLPHLASCHAGRPQTQPALRCANKTPHTQAEEDGAAGCVTRCSSCCSGYRRHRGKASKLRGTSATAASLIAPAVGACRHCMC